MRVKPKILHFMWSANFGGIEKLVIDLTRTQNQSDHISAEIMVGCNKGSFKDKLIDTLTPHTYANLKSGFDFNPSVYVKVKAKMKEFDIIHFHTFNSLIFKAAINSGKKICYTVHGNFNLGRKVTFTDRITNSIRNYCINNYVDYITFNSKFTQKIAIEKYHLKNIKDGIIYNGIPFKKPSEIPEITSAEHLLFLKNKFVIGTSCRFNAFKRIDRLIDAFSEFAKDKPDVVLLLVGDGVMKQKLEARVNQLNINSRVLFAGFQSNVQGYQKLMNICVFPSEDEPFGLVAVETLAMGKPTIVFKDAGGMLEILINDFPDDIVADIPELVQKLNYYYESKNTVNNILAHKREEIASRFDIKSMEEAFFAEYVKLLTS